MFTSKVILLIFLTNIIALKTFATNTCSVSAPTVAFGNFNPLNYTSQTISATFTVTCSSNSTSATTSPTVTFSIGNSGSFSSRTMNNGSKSLSYNLYKDSGYTQILGDGTGSTYTYSLSYTLNSANNYSSSSTTTFYGKIPSQPTAATGNYTDSIIITINYT